jgi:hypothetical protein
MLRACSTVNVAFRFEPGSFSITMAVSGLPEFDLLTNLFCTEHVARMGEILKCIQGFIEA